MDTQHINLHISVPTTLMGFELFNLLNAHRKELSDFVESLSPGIASGVQLTRIQLQR